MNKSVLVFCSLLITSQAYANSISTDRLGNVTVNIFTGSNTIAGADEGLWITGLQISTINCAGAGITCTDAGNGIFTLTVPGGGVGGGGGSSLAITTGTFAKYDGIPVTSPTAIVVLSSAVMSVQLAGGATAYIDIVYSSVTAQGDVLLAVRSSTQAGAAFFSLSLTTTISKNDFNNFNSTNSQRLQDVQVSTGTYASFDSGRTSTANVLSDNLSVATNTLLNMISSNSVVVAGLKTATSTILNMVSSNAVVLAGVPASTQAYALIVANDTSPIKDLQNKVSTQTLVYNAGIALTAFVQGANVTLSQSGSSLTIAAAAGGGGSSSLAITTGTLAKFDGIPVSSPTAIIVLSSAAFQMAFTGGATAYIDVNYSSVTAQGDVLNAVGTSTRASASAFSGFISTTISKADFNLLNSTNMTKQAAQDAWFSTISVAIDAHTSTITAISIATTNLSIALAIATNAVTSADIFGRTYYLHHETTGPFSVYNQIASTPDVGAEITKVQSVASADGLVKISSFITLNLDPGTNKIPAGGWDFTTWFQASNVLSIDNLVISIATCDFDGSNPAEIVSSTSSNITSLGVNRYDTTVIQPNDLYISTGHRLIATYSARTTSVGAVTFTLYYAGTSRTTHFDAPLADVYRFNQLSDVPQSYVGQNNKYLALNNDATALVFVSTDIDRLNALATDTTTMRTNIAASTNAMMANISVDISTAIKKADFTTHITTADTRLQDVQKATGTYAGVVASDTSPIRDLQNKVSTQTLVYNGGVALTAFVQGSNITLTQNGSSLTIAGTAGGGGGGGSGWWHRLRQGTNTQITSGTFVGSHINNIASDAAGASTFTIGTSSLPYVMLSVPAQSLRGRPGKFSASDFAGGVSISTCPSTTPDGDKKPCLDYFAFAPSTRQFAGWQTSLSSGGYNGWLVNSTFSFTSSVFVSSGAAAGKQIQMCTRLACTGGQTALSSVVWGTSVCINIPDMTTNMAVYNSSQSLSITPGGTCLGGGGLLGQVFRNPGDGNDNIGGTTGNFVNLLHLNYYYRKSDMMQDDVFQR